METKRVLTLCAALVVILSVSFLFLNQCKRPPKPDATATEPLAEMLAAETVRVVSGRGQAVIIADEGSQVNGLTANLDRSLREKGPGLTIAIEVIPMAPSKGPEDIGLKPSDLDRIVGKYSDCAVIVSLVGPPLVTSGSNSKRPKLVVFAPLGTGIKTLLAQGIIDVAIVPSISPPPPDPLSPGGTSAIPRYQVVTRENVSSLTFEPPVPRPPP